mmetsp:Transcript_42886/g.81801  ORF Transcript_42886/g.81801 Transcript_42886/m.81801 type:complete len:294 (-) Transcript_42886:1086-1967(-)
MRPVITKPPPMLTADTSTASAARAWAGVSGRKPPPTHRSPPMAVTPEMALVTDMRGECSAGVTPITILYPTSPARQKMLSMDVSSAWSPAAAPIPRNAMPATARIAEPEAAASRLARSAASAASAAVGTGNTRAATGAFLLAGTSTGGGGYASTPFSTTSALRTATSLRSIANSRPSSTSRDMERKKLEALLEYKAEDCAAMREGKSVNPRHVTPACTTAFSGTVVATLPPASAARSTMTDPGLMLSTISLVMSTGAARPGMSAVVMMTSTSRACSANNAISARWNASDICLA